RLRAQLKFTLQMLAGVGLVAAGATLALTPWYLVNVVVTVFWFVALTNAFNLLDNMDGVAAGVGAVAALFLGVTFAFQGAWLHAAVAWSLAGAALGFLRYNFHPATIFMGDAGSLFVGSLLAGLVMTSPASASGSLVAVLFVPLAIVAVPIVDTALLYKRRLAAMLLDVVLVAVAYYGAFRLKFEGGAAPPGYMDAYQATLGFVIALKVIVFASFGMYRGAWRYTSMVDLYRTLVAVAVSSTALYWYAQWRVPTMATSNVLYIDALLTAAFVLSARLSFR